MSKDYYNARMQRLKEVKRLRERNNDASAIRTLEARIDELEQAKQALYGKPANKPAAPEAEAPAKDLDQGGDGALAPEADWEDYTVSELKDIARDRDLSGYSSMNKDELIELISGEAS